MERIREMLKKVVGRFSSSTEQSSADSSVSQEQEGAELHPRYLLRLRIQNALRERTELPKQSPSIQAAANPTPTSENVAPVEEAPPRSIPNDLVFMWPPVRQKVLGRYLLTSKLRRKLVRRPQLMSLVTQDGLRGMGLSNLAAHIYYHDGDKFFPDGKYWLDFSGGNAKSALRALLHELKVDSKKMRNNLSTLSRLLHEQLAEKRVLLVLDHAEALSPKNPAEVLRQIEQIRLPSPAITLVTSQFSLYPKQDIQVDLLSETDGLAFLRRKLAWKRKDEKAEREHAVQLIERLGSLPLALELTTTRMKRHTPSQNCQMVLTELEDEANQAQAHQLPFSQKGEQYVAETFLLSYNMLSEESKTLFHALGICAPSGVSVIALARIIDKSPNELDIWLVELNTYSLITYDSEHGRARMHGLLYDYAAFLAQKDHEAYQKMLTRHQQYFKEEIAGRYEQALNNPQEQESLLALQQIDAEADNVRLAQQRAFSNH